MFVVCQSHLWQFQICLCATFETMYLKKSFKTNCICNHLYQVNAYHVVCLSLYPVCLPRQPGWQWPGAPQRVGAHGGEDLGGERRQRGEHKVPAALHLPLRLPRRGGRRGAPGRWHHTSTHLPPNPAPSSPALRHRPAGRVKCQPQNGGFLCTFGQQLDGYNYSTRWRPGTRKGSSTDLLPPMLLLLK